jgi:hypothetical protein
LLSWLTESPLELTAVYDTDVLEVRSPRLLANNTVALLTRICQEVFGPEVHFLHLMKKATLC